VTKIVAISAQPIARPPAARAAARATMAQPKGPAPTAYPGPSLPPASPKVDPATLAELIQVQADKGKGHEDPQPDHGRDDEHGHQPPPVTPPVTTPPVVTPPPVTPPPVVQPPVAQPPGVQPPVVTPPPVTETPVVVAAPPKPAPLNDPGAPARAQAIVARALGEGVAAQASRAAFAAAAAQQRAARVMAQGGAALAILQTLDADISAFRSYAHGQYEAIRRSTYA